MKKIIGFNIVRGPKEIKGLKASFIANGRKTEVDKESNLLELFKTEEGIYSNNVNLVFGKNSSGKTNFLQMTNFLNRITNVGFEYKFNEDDFKFYLGKEETAKTQTYFSINNFLVRHTMEFYFDKFHLLNVIEEEISYLNVEVNKNISTAMIEELILSGKNSLIKSDIKLSFDLLYKKSKDGYSEETELFNSHNEFMESNFVGIVSRFILKMQDGKYDNLRECLEDSFIQIAPHVIPPNIGDGVFMKRIMHDDEDSREAIKFASIFDKEIKNIKYDPDFESYEVSFRNGKSIPTKKLSGLLSTGTIKGMMLLAMVKRTLKLGHDIYLDEIEANFNKKIVSYIIDLFMNFKINNKGARLFASTHFMESLDRTSRRDAVYLTEWISRKQKVTRLNEVNDDTVSKIIGKREISNSKVISKLIDVELQPSIEDRYNFERSFN